MYVINFFAWCNDAKHDKVWGYVTVNENEIYRFYGRRGHQLSFYKEDETDWSVAHNLAKTAAKKVRAGRRSGQYVEVAPSGITQVWDDFHTTFERQLIRAKLSGIFRYGGEVEEAEQ